MEHKQGDPLVGHVDEPLDAEGVEGGDKVAEDPDEHEEGDEDSVGNVPQRRGTAAVPYAVQKADLS